MSKEKPAGKEKTLWEKFRTSENTWVSLARELLWVAVVVGGIALALFLISGTWPAVVTIESESMVPHMQVGDLVFVVSADRLGPLQSWAEGQAGGYTKFGDFGDVIVYRPNGADSVHPIIHRAMVWAEDGQSFQISTGNLNYTYTAPHDGYITKGDHNGVIDQTGWPSGYRGLGPLEPVREEWIVGKAVFSIPILGYLPLNIVPVAVILIVLMLVWEYYAGKKESAKGGKKKLKKSNK